MYNRWGRRDNAYKARIKILVKAEGQRYKDEVNAEYQAILQNDGGVHTITQAEFDRVSRSFVAPVRDLTAPAYRASKDYSEDKAYTRWLQQNVADHQNPALAIVTLSFKRPGHSPGDANAEQLSYAADLTDTFSAGEARVSHDQNLVLPWVRKIDLPALYEQAKAADLARSHTRLLTDMIACPGGDFCA